jgi:hypothetical protein
LLLQSSGNYTSIPGQLTCQVRVSIPVPSETWTRIARARGFKSVPGIASPTTFKPFSVSLLVQSQVCPAGRFASGYGATACVACPAGSFGTVPGATGCQKCLVCLLFHELSASVARACVGLTIVEHAHCCIQAAYERSDGRTDVLCVAILQSGRFANSTGANFCSMCQVRCI